MKALKKKHGRLLDLPQPTKEGYRFAGWNYNNQTLQHTYMPSRNLHLEAIWTDFILYEYEIEVFSSLTNGEITNRGGYARASLDSDENGSHDSYMYYENERVNLEAFPADGSSFYGWYDNPYGDTVNGTRYSNLTSYNFKAKEDKEIYAVFNNREITLKGYIYVDGQIADTIDDEGGVIKLEKESNDDYSLSSGIPKYRAFLRYSSENSFAISSKFIIEQTYSVMNLKVGIKGKE